MEKAAVGTGSNLVDDIRLKVDVEGTGNMFSARSFGEEGAEPIITGRSSAFNQTAIGLAKRFVRKITSSTRTGTWHYSR